MGTRETTEATSMHAPSSSLKLSTNVQVFNYSAANNGASTFHIYVLRKKELTSSRAGTVFPDNPLELVRDE